jgi:molybdenum cofactor biosynthesis enzyme MoaA
MGLRDIGFYTLSNKRAKQCSETSPLWRCELICTPKCNLRCPYCRPLREEAKKELTFNDALGILDKWIRQGLKNIRFSGGEPTLWGPLIQCVNICAKRGVERIAISTNGTASLDTYKSLIDTGVNDISVSLDSACCATGQQMNGGFEDQWKNSVETIQEVSKLCYTTVGVVLTDDNIQDTIKIIDFAHGLGDQDIRIIPAAQHGAILPDVDVYDHVLDAHPILKYRYNHLKNDVPVRGLSKTDSPRCYLTLDDMVVAGHHHWPCIIYMREHGEPIGHFGKHFRRHRARWSENHNSLLDPICRSNCLDVCRDYNNYVHSKRTK